MRAIGHAPAAAALVLGAMLASDVRGHVVVLLDRQLQARTVDLISIMSGKVTFTAPPGGEDGAGDVKTITLDSVAAIVEPSWWVGELSPPRLDPRDSQNLGLLELTDGRMITGKLDIPLDASSDSAAEPPKDILRWQHGGILDRLEFKLDEVRRVRMPGAPMTVNDEAAAPKRQDTVILINGDRLSGLVERIGAEIWVSDAGAMTKTPTSRVSEIRLVNPPAAPTGTLVWLQGGTIMRVEHVGADPQRGLLLGIEPAEGKSRQVFAPSDKVEALLPDKSRFHPLSTLKIATQHPGPGRAVSFEPARVIAGTDELLGVADIELPGPMTVDWTLPTGIAHFAGWLVLPLSCRQWGDCLVRIDAVGRDGQASPLVSEHVNAERHTVEVNAALPPQSTLLRVTIDAGAFGPIQDRIIVHRAVLTR